MSLEKPVIAIDGYSSCGKSTVAKALARKLGLRYIDSGAMYRAVTYYFLENKIPIPFPEELDNLTYDFESVLNNIAIAFSINQSSGASEITLNGENVEKEIRSLRVSENVSHVSAIPPVRKKMVFQQQRFDDGNGLVMDGRDIGTTVFPNADLKIFMMADENIRSKRRYDELIGKGIKVSLNEVVNNINSRDYEDTNRHESPLRKADDAVVLDNSYLNFEEQLDFVLKAIEKTGIRV